MTPEHRSVEVAPGEQEWYSLREVAAALGISRQAVHARVRKGQLDADQVDGAWRVASAVVAAAVQAERSKALALGAVRMLPASAGRPDGDVADLLRRVVEIEATLTDLSESHRRELDERDRELGERDRELAVLRDQGERLMSALHYMVDALGMASSPDHGG